MRGELPHFEALPRIAGSCRFRALRPEASAERGRAGIEASVEQLQPWRSPR